MAGMEARSELCVRGMEGPVDESLPKGSDVTLGMMPCRNQQPKKPSLKMKHAGPQTAGRLLLQFQCRQGGHPAVMVARMVPPMSLRVLDKSDPHLFGDWSAADGP